MRFIHTADLHLGKRVHEFSLIRDQEAVLAAILDLCLREGAQALILAGDIYDKSVPAVEAILLLESFLLDLSEAGITVLMVAGNHDSGERLSFGGSFMKSHKIHIAGVYEGQVEAVPLEDEEGPVTFHLLPFIRPSDVRRFFPEASIQSVSDAVETVLSSIEKGPGRHVLLAHQFVTAGGRSPLRSESELLQVGTVDEVDESIFSGFDYVALGHLHGFQRIGEGPVYYSGSPLPYSFSEAHHTKGALLVDLAGGPARVRQLPLPALHAMRRIRGEMAELLAEGRNMENKEDPARLDYLEITLTDEGAVADPMNRLRSVYPNIMRLLFSRGESDSWEQDTLIMGEDLSVMEPAELFSGFFLEQTGRPLTGRQSQVVGEVARETEGAGV